MVGRIDNIDKTSKQVIIGCECGCQQAINIVRYEDYSYVFDVETNKELKSKSYDYYITLSSGFFYGKQIGIFKTIGRRLKAAWYMLRGKEYLFGDVNIHSEDIDKLIELLKEIRDEK